MPGASTLTAVLATIALVAPGATLAATPRANLLDIEDEVMCTVCGIPLIEATEAPQAQRERALIRKLIAQGLTKGQIKDRLVNEFGPSVLALPERKGFNWAAYLVPIALVLAGAAGLAVVLPRWRRRARAAAGPREDAAPLPEADARKLADDLARYDL
jgi:cytochrome c-type biogenesis protein CcmH